MVRNPPAEKILDGEDLAVTKTKGEYTVVCVDDDPVNLKVVATMLKGSSYGLEVSSDPNQVLQRVLEDPPDLLLLDVMMPGLDGFVFCERVRERHSMATLPIILLTARDQDEAVVRGFAAGANDYVTKPFSQKTLLARMGFQLAMVEKAKATQEELTARLSEEESLRLEYEEKYGDRKLSEDRGLEIEEALKRLMEEEELFLDPLVKMKKVARKLKVKQADLSQVLNDRLGCNFHSYINDLRVNYICRKLDSGWDGTLLDLAYSAGFSSKSTFHVQFKARTGLTPSQYKKQK